MDNGSWEKEAATDTHGTVDGLGIQGAAPLEHHRLHSPNPRNTFPHETEVLDQGAGGLVCGQASLPGLQKQCLLVFLMGSVLVHIPCLFLFL